MSRKQAEKLRRRALVAQAQERREAAVEARELGLAARERSLGIAAHRYQVCVVISAERLEQARDLLASFTDVVEVGRPGRDRVQQTASYDARLYVREVKR